ncbi:replication initiation protein [Paracraurococcus lichenis]|uniref:Replication initiation protein n=1 Tax=Paracraurococcus lichenis TaxID=3064888 RepID=A0ABT9EDS8_9PROT|nr:replication initiation protein [Paracraurococcus sp. LOR1-02]MDO9714170.1 replication initiation protein [Paracraurococcus sp. LOR1-02]
MRAAFVRPQEIGGGDGVVKAGELVDATYPDGASLSGAARKVLVLLLAKAAGDAWKDREFCITKGELRGRHKGNERLDKVLDELQRTLLRVRVRSPRGQDAVQVAAVMQSRTEELSDDAQSLVYWRFSEPMRLIMQASDHYAELQRQAVLAFDSRYSVTLYEQGCLRYRRQHPVWHGTLQELREMLGVPSGRYRDWTDLRRFTLEAAKVEIDHLAPFILTWQEFRRGRAVERVEIQFTPKDDNARAEAEAEIQRSRVGRKARRTGAVETVAGIAPEVAAELARLRKG